MPYVICEACQLRTYSAALWASTDGCPRCGTELPRARRTAKLEGGARAHALVSSSVGRAFDPFAESDDA
jgi:uncharacterized paraquat-inducible protein A